MDGLTLIYSAGDGRIHTARAVTDGALLPCGQRLHKPAAPHCGPDFCRRCLYLAALGERALARVV